MSNLLYLIAPFGCVIGMVVCMAMMGRGKKQSHTEPDRPASASEVADLRAEIARLRAEQPAKTEG